MSAERVSIIYRKSVLARICTRCCIEFATVGKKSCQPCLDRKAQYQMEVKARKRAVNPRGLNTLPPAVERRRRNRRENNVIDFPVPTKIADQPWKGKYWYDMKAADEFIQRCLFSLFRRGLYDPDKPKGKRYTVTTDMLNFSKFKRS